MYLLFAVKPESADYCRGCHMASYSSESYKKNFLSSEALKEQLAVYYLRNKQLRINEDGFGFVIFRNGIQVYDSVENSGWYWDGEERWEHDSDEYWENQELNDKERGEAYGELGQIMEEAKALAEIKFAEVKKKEEEEEEERKRKEIETAKESRRKDFEKLKAEFS